MPKKDITRLKIKKNVILYISCIDIVDRPYCVAAHCSVLMQNIFIGKWYLFFLLPRNSLIVDSDRVVMEETGIAVIQINFLRPQGLQITINVRCNGRKKRIPTSILILYPCILYIYYTYIYICVRLGVQVDIANVFFFQFRMSKKIVPLLGIQGQKNACVVVYFSNITSSQECASHTSFPTWLHRF